MAGIPGLALPQVPAWADPVWHLFVVRTAPRDALQAALLEQGIHTLIHYPVAPHRQQAYAELHIPRGSLPVAETLADPVLSLPMGPHLSTAEVERTAAAIRGFFGG